MGNVLQRPVSENLDKFDVKVDYDDRFHELEYRSLRAYFMNFDEASYFDQRAAKWEWAFYGLGLFTIAFTAAAVTKGNAKLGAIAGIFSSGTLVSLVEGTSHMDWVRESSKTRAQKHVNAGADWLRICRLSNLYRDIYLKEQLNTRAQVDTEQVHLTRYNELLELYSKATGCTAIRPQTYKDYRQVNKVITEYRKRTDEFLQFKQMDDPINSEFEAKQT